MAFEQAQAAVEAAEAQTVALAEAAVVARFYDSDSGE